MGKGVAEGEAHRWHFHHRSGSYCEIVCLARGRLTFPFSSSLPRFFPAFPLRLPPPLSPSSSSSSFFFISPLLFLLLFAQYSAASCYCKAESRNIVFLTQPGLGRSFGSCAWSALCAISWGPWPQRMSRKSSEPDRTVGGRAEQPSTPREHAWL